MQIIITGGGGFLGQMLAKALIKSTISFEELLLVDIALPAVPAQDPRIVCQQTDLTQAGTCEALVTPQTGILFHLAAVVSSHAEADFDIGWVVNLDMTRRLLEACRGQTSPVTFVFASSCAVFGGALPEVVQPHTALWPQSSYGAQKAICELLLNDYSRKGYVDGRALRLPTVCVRPGKPNLAASSFVSSIIREPLSGQVANCPVPTHLPVWVASPDAITQNFIHAAMLPAEALGDWRVLNMPGLTVTVQEMLDTLRAATDEQTLAYVTFEKNDAISAIVNTWPTRIDTTPADRLGFVRDQNFADIVTQYLQNKF